MFKRDHTINGLEQLSTVAIFFYPLIHHAIMLLMCNYLYPIFSELGERTQGEYQGVNLTRCLFKNLKYLKQIFVEVAGCLFNHLLSKLKPDSISLRGSDFLLVVQR